MSFSEWVKLRESRASTRSRNAAAKGLMPMAVVTSPHGHSTASPFETKQIKKAIKKKFRGHAGHRKISPKFKNAGIDTWIKEVDSLKQAVAKLKAIFDSKKSTKSEKPEEKEEEEKLDKVNKTDKKSDKIEKLDDDKKEKDTESDDKNSTKKEVSEKINQLKEKIAVKKAKNNV